MLFHYHCQSRCGSVYDSDRIQQSRVRLCGRYRSQRKRRYRRYRRKRFYIACALCVTPLAPHHFMTENEISRVIYESAIEAHKTLGGPGLIESVYEEALVYELQKAGLKVDRQVSLPIVYKEQTLSSPLRIDLIVGDKVIVECKSTALYNEIFETQLLTYLRLTGLKLGLVVNFGEKRVKDGIHRVVNGL